MKRLIPISAILISLILSACSVSKRMSIIPKMPADSLFVNEKVDVIDYEKKYSEYDAVYLFFDDVYEHTASKTLDFGSWGYHRSHKEKYLILNTDAKDFTTFSLELGKIINVNNIYLITLSPSGEVKKIQMNELQKEFPSPYRVSYKFAIPNVEKGTIVECAYDYSYPKYINFHPPLEYTIPLQFEYPCEDLSLMFAYPDWFKIDIKKFSHIEKSEIIDTLNDDFNKRIVKYSAKNIGALRDEPFSPYFKEMAKYLQLKFSFIDVGMSYYEPRTWEELSASFRKYAMNKEGFFSFSVGNLSDELTSQCKTQFEILEKIVSHVQQNIKISDDYEDRSFGDILDDGEGNIYEICGLTHSLLKKAGLEPKYILIHSAADGILDKEYISSSQFELPAVKVEIDSNVYVTFPYFENMPVEIIPDFIQGQKALEVDRNSDFRNSFWEVPLSNNTANSLTENYILNINEDGNISVREEKTLLGSMAYSARNYLAELKEDEKEEKIKDLLTYTDGEVKFDSFDIIDLDNYKNPLKLNLEYTINNLVTVTPDEVIFQTGGLLSPRSMIKNKIDAKKRNNPIKIYYEEITNKNIEINFPKSWTPATKLEDVKYQNEIGSLKGNYKITNGSIIINQQSRLNKCNEPKEKINELLEVTGSASKLSIPTIIFSISNEENGN